MRFVVVAHQSVLAGMRIDAEHAKAGLLDTEMPRRGDGRLCKRDHELGRKPGECRADRLVQVAWAM
jgi:hypothetical protein